MGFSEMNYASMLFKISLIYLHAYSKSKKKVMLSHSCHAGAKGDSSYSFLTSALDEGERSASSSGRALLPGKGPPVPIA
jgi:hypothetical protein